MSNEIATLPITAHFNIVRKFIERERKMRDVVLKGSNRLRGLDDADSALESLKVIESAMRKP